MKNNPILKTLVDGDVVMMEVPSSLRNSLKQICRITNLKFTEAENDRKFDWLEFDGEVLYTNTRLHKSHLNDPIGNCLAITEKLTNSDIAKIAKINNLWAFSDDLMSDAELEYAKARAVNSFNYL